MYRPVFGPDPPHPLHLISGNCGSLAGLPLPDPQYGTVPHQAKFDVFQEAIYAETFINALYAWVKKKCFPQGVRRDPHM